MRNSQWKQVLKNYVVNNYKEYILVGLLFVIGLFAGVMIVNNCNEENMSDVMTYISGFVTKFKQIDNINKVALIMKSIKSNVLLAVIIWFAGTTVIGLPVVLATILFRGAVLGLSISAFTCTLGTLKGIGFCLTSLLLQNILFIPAILTLGVSSIKLYKSILKDKRRENIKLEIIRHTVISSLMIGILIISSIIENLISLGLLKKFIKYF